MASTPDMTAPVTRGELREELQQLEQKLDQKLEQRLANYATKHDLEVWGHTIVATLRAEMKLMFETEMPRHFGIMAEEMRRWIAGLDDKYRDLPGRVDKLEARVFAPKRRRR